MAAKAGGPDPDSNPALRSAIATAKAENMPKDNVKKAIERAEGKDAADFQEVNYEGKGPHGVLIWVECATDNNTRTFSNVRMIFNKNDGQLLESGALGFMFNRKAVFQFPKGDHELEEIELELIDAGLEEMEVIEETVYVYGEFEAFGSLAKNWKSSASRPPRAICSASLPLPSSSPTNKSKKQKSSSTSSTTTRTCKRSTPILLRPLLDVPLSELGSISSLSPCSNPFSTKSDVPPSRPAKSRYAVLNVRRTEN